MADITTINSPVWGLSTLGYGTLVEGLASVRQCLAIILTTKKGTDPLRPDFGCDIMDYMDLPQDKAIPNMKRAIIDAIDIWETRVKVKRVTHTMKEPHNPEFYITFSLVDDELIDQITLDLQNGVTQSADDQEVILQAFYPPNPKGYPYQISFIKSGEQVLPLPQPNGYQSLQEMFSWVQTNWLYYGRWNMLGDRYMLYMSAKNLTSPTTLSISVLPIVTFYAVIPTLGVGDVYSVAFKVDGVDATPAPPADLNTPGALLGWVQANWSGYASWGIESIEGSAEPVFSDEFSDEFDTSTSAVIYRLVGVSNVEDFAAELSIGVVKSTVFTNEFTNEFDADQATN